MYRPFVASVPSSSVFLDVESAIRGLTQDYCTAFNTGNYDHVAALFAADGILMLPNQEQAQGAKAIEHALRRLGELGFEELRLDTVRVDYSGDMAIETGRYTLAVRKTDGTTTIDRGKYVHAWRRFGVWRMIADMWNSNLPVGRS